MEINTLKKEDIFKIIIKGDLDASSAVMLDNAIFEAQRKGEKKIVFDCTDLNFISSAGLGVFMSYIQDFKEANIEMVLFGMSDKIKTVFSILGLEKLLKIYISEEEAYNACNAK